MNNTATQVETTPEAIAFRVDAKILLQAIAFVAPGISGEATRYYLNGVFFEKKAGEPLRLVTTDGHRLHKIDVESTGFEGGEEFTFILCKYELPVLKAALKGEKFANITVALNRSGIFEPVINNRPYKVIDGRFPDYARVIPSHDKAAALAGYNAKYLADAFKSFAGLGVGKWSGIRVTTHGSGVDSDPIVLKN